MLTPEVCHQARLSRDPRFDGLFFIAVKSTGIFCRTICPARLPAEPQVTYFNSAAAATEAGFRPCLRCRPDSAPGSAAWQGTQTTLKRALNLIEQGALQQQNQQELAERLGISERYLRKLFQQELGIAPQRYALLQQVLFAKKLLHETSLSISQIAAQSGFNSLRRFNDAFKKELKMPPSQIRRRKPDSSNIIELSLSYRPPLAWQQMLDFWHKRTLNGIEWVNDLTYGRTFTWQQQPGWFEVSPKEPDQLQLKLYWPAEQGLFSLLKQLRRLFDLDADINLIEQQLLQHPLFQHGIISGLRIPGIWNSWEAGVRAVLGQQVSVAAARTHLNRLVAGLGTALPGSSDKMLFPSPAAVMHSELDMLKMPQRRKETLRALATYMAEHPEADPEQWLALKGIGPWTVNYAKMRGASDSDIWLGGDLGIQKALQQLAAANTISTDTLAPWRSYATFQLWFNGGN